MRHRPNFDSTCVWEVGPVFIETRYNFEGVSLPVCLPDDNVRKPIDIGSSSSLNAHIRYISIKEYGASSYMKVVRQGQSHRSKKVENPYSRNVELRSAIIPIPYSVSQKSSPLKLASIFSLLANPFTWKFSWLFPKHVLTFTTILVRIWILYKLNNSFKFITKFLIYLYKNKSNHIIFN